MKLYQTRHADLVTGFDFSNRIMGWSIDPVIGGLGGLVQNEEGWGQHALLYPGSASTFINQGSWAIYQKMIAKNDSFFSIAVALWAMAAAAEWTVDDRYYQLSGKVTEEELRFLHDSWYSPGKYSTELALIAIRWRRGILDRCKALTLPSIVLTKPGSLNAHSGYDPRFSSTTRTVQYRLSPNTECEIWITNQAARNVGVSVFVDSDDLTFEQKTGDLRTSRKFMYSEAWHEKQKCYGTVQIEAGRAAYVRGFVCPPEGHRVLNLRYYIDAWENDLFQMATSEFHLPLCIGGDQIWVWKA